MAKAIRRCLLEDTGSSWSEATGTKITLGGLEGAFGAAEWAAIQRVQFTDSMPLEW
jgi:hypothetical protein